MPRTAPTRELLPPACSVVLRTAGGAAAVVALGACGSGAPTVTAPPRAAAAGSSASADTASAPPGGGAPSSRSASRSALPVSGPGRPQSFTTTVLSGTRGSGSWNITIPVFTGSASSAQVSRRVRASAQDAIDHNGKGCSLTGRSDLSRNDGRTVQVRLDLVEDCGGAHPTVQVNTVVLNAATAEPVSLGQVFPHEIAALRDLAPQIRRLAAAKGEQIQGPGQAGLAPVEGNWAAWQTTAAGMTFDFQDFQLGGHGIRSYTVPWAVVKPLMSPRAYALLF